MFDVDVNGVNNDATTEPKNTPPPVYSSTNGPSNGHIPQNYYLTGDDGGDPSPSGSNETAQSDLWMMNGDGMNPNDVAMSYHPAYGTTTHNQIDPNAYSYSYYAHDEYQPLSDEALNMDMNIKNSICKLI